MKAGWIAGVTRGRLLLSRAVGAEHARTIAGCASLQEAQAALAGSAYGQRVSAGLPLHAAERAIGDTLLWHLRILAGWLPMAGAGLVRALAGWFELANVDARLAALAGGVREPPPFELGGLATAWQAIERAAGTEEMADAVARSAWGDPGGRSAPALALGLRVAWARRVQTAAPEATDWVAGAGALLLARATLMGEARQRQAADLDAERQLSRLPGIGERSAGARSLQELHDALSVHAAWALAGAREPEDLWRAELGWWRRVEGDAQALLRRGSDEATVLAVVALLAADAQRTARALRVAATGGAAAEIGGLLDGGY